MPVSSVLVGGEGGSGVTPAAALARMGLETTLVERDAGLPDETQQSLRDLGVEVRLTTTLLGSVTVDRHVEAELSDGRVENYDVIVLAPAGAARRIIASGRADGSDAVAAVERTLATLDPPA